MDQEKMEAWFRKVLAAYPTGVCVITTTDEHGAPLGLVVGSFTSVSMTPPLVGFFVDKKSTSWPKVRQTGKFCVNVLSDQQEHVCRQVSKPGDEKFRGLSYDLSANGAPIIAGALAWIDCTLAHEGEAGDHYSVLGSVRELTLGEDKSPLVFFRGGYGTVQKLQGHRGSA